MQSMLATLDESGDVRVWASTVPINCADLLTHLERRGDVGFVYGLEAQRSPDGKIEWIQRSYGYGHGTDFGIVLSEGREALANVTVDNRPGGRVRVYFGEVAAPTVLDKKVSVAGTLEASVCSAAPRASGADGRD